MIGVRLSDPYEEKFIEIARRANMKPGPLARRVLIAFIEQEHDKEAAFVGRLSRLEEHNTAITRLVARLIRKVDRFLDHAEIVDLA